MSVCLLKTTKCQQGSKLLISGKVTCSLHTNQICHDATIYMLQRANSHLKKNGCMQRITSFDFSN